MRTIFRFLAQEDKCEVIIHVQLYAYGPAQHACDKLIFSLIDRHSTKHGLDWTGLDSWTGQLDWTAGLDSWTGQLDLTVGLGFFSIK